MRGQLKAIKFGIIKHPKNKSLEIKILHLPYIRLKATSFKGKF